MYVSAMCLSICRRSFSGPGGCGGPTPSLPVDIQFIIQLQLLTYTICYTVYHTVTNYYTCHLLNTTHCIIYYTIAIINYAHIEYYVYIVQLSCNCNYNYDLYIVQFIIQLHVLLNKHIKHMFIMCIIKCMPIYISRLISYLVTIITISNNMFSVITVMYMYIIMIIIMIIIR